MSSVTLERPGGSKDTANRRRVPSLIVGKLRQRWPTWLNVAALSSLLAGLLFDPSFVDEITRKIVLRVEPVESWSDLWTTSGMLMLLIAAVLALSGIGLVAQLAWGDAAQRTIWAWMRLSTLVCFWLVAITQWSELAWLGKEWRVSRDVPAFDSVAATLRSDWPTEDGDTSVTGPFMAYPIGDPRTLLLLTSPELSPSGATFCAVERSASGGLRFQLAGSEFGDWIEWHPDHAEPSSFIGGLGESFALERSRDLGGGWHLVRYHAS